jgi:hypothetical protein
VGATISFLTSASKSYALQMSRPPSSDCAMAVIGLVAVGLLGGGFMLYVLFQWMRDEVRNRNQ